MRWRAPGNPLIGRAPVIDQQRLPGADAQSVLHVVHLVVAHLPIGVGPHGQFVGGTLQPDEISHTRDQRDLAVGLGEKIIHSGFEPTDPIGRLSSAVTMTIGT